MAPAEPSLIVHTSVRPPLRRRLLAVLGLVLPALAGLLLGVLSGAYWYRDDLARGMLRGELNRLTHQGPALHIGRVEPHGVSGVTLRDVRLDPRPGATNPAFALSVDAIDVRWSFPALLTGRLRLGSVDLVGPRVRIDVRQGAGRVLQDVQPLRQLLSARLRPRSASGKSGGGSSHTLPPLAVTGGSLELVGTGLGVQAVELRLERSGDDLQVEGTFSPLGMEGGPCRISGNVGSGLRQGAAQLECASPLTLRRDQVAAHIAGMRLALGDEPPLISEEERRRLLLPSDPASDEVRLTVTLPAIEVVAPVPGDPEPKPRLSGALRMVLGEQAGLGVEGKLQTPPSGNVVVLGHLHPGQRQAALDLHIEGLDLARSPLPALLPGNLDSGTLQADVAVDLADHGRRLDVIGQVHVADLQYFHERLARSPVSFSSLDADIDLAADLTERRLESVASRLMVNRIPLTLDGEVDMGRGAPLVRLRLGTGQLAADDLVASVPRALLPRLQLRGVRGEASFGAYLLLDMARPDQLQLDVNPDVSKLIIDSLGPNLDLSQLGRRFTHTWEDEQRREMYRFETGPGSAAWCPLSEIPEILRTAVLAQEDGGFMYHRGFSLLHIRNSLILNIQTGRFARGASTITMQLARNLFLGREKLLSRKLEEAILTWQLERSRSKESLLETYLNIIEWGQGIFGIRAAAEHYFGKSPAQLTTAEAIFLSTAIPFPRWVDRNFQQGKIGKNHENLIKWMLGLMHGRSHLDDAAYEAAIAETIKLQDPSAAKPPLPNLWDTESHREGAHQVTPSENDDNEEPGLPPELPAGNGAPILGAPGIPAPAPAPAPSPAASTPPPQK